MHAHAHTHAYKCCTFAHKQGGYSHDPWLDLAGKLNVKNLSVAIDSCQDRTLQDLLRRLCAVLRIESAEGRMQVRYHAEWVTLCVFQQVYTSLGKCYIPTNGEVQLACGGRPCLRLFI